MHVEPIVLGQNTLLNQLIVFFLLFQSIMPYSKIHSHQLSDMLRITEAAAIAAANHIGSGDKIAGDKAAVDAMRTVFNTIPIKGTVIIGEGEKDEAPMLYNGEEVGTNQGIAVDIAVDPVEGTNLLALGRANAITVLAMTESGGMWNPDASLYMNKIVVEQKAKTAIDITQPATHNLQSISIALGKSISELTVFVLDKPRHKNLITEIRKAGAKVSLQTDGDVMGALLAASPNTEIDVLMGIGGTPEGVIAAAAVKALGGGMQAMRAPQLENERKALEENHVNINEVLELNDLIKSEDALFAATGITGGTFLRAVKFNKDTVTTHSIAIRALTSSVQYIKNVQRKGSFLKS